MISRKQFMKLGGLGALLPLSPAAPHAQSVIPLPAYYSSFVFNSGSLPYKAQKNLSSSFFPDQRDGPVSWYDPAQGYFNAHWNFIKVSGSISMKNAPGVFLLTLRIYRKSDGALLNHYPLANTSAQVAPFSAVVVGIAPDMYFTLTAYQEYALSSNAIRPNILFEAIE